MVMWECDTELPKGTRGNKNIYAEQNALARRCEYSALGGSQGERKGTCACGQHV